jgi:cytochrome c
MSFSAYSRHLILFALLGCVGWTASADRASAQTIGTFGVQEEEVEHRPDPAHGETLFRACLKCHAVEPGETKIGPSLAGILGRRPGSVPEFGYSQDMIDFGQSGGIWNTETLDRFLTRPRAMFAGTKMVFFGFKKPEDRADLIAFLSALRG